LRRAALLLAALVIMSLAVVRYVPPPPLVVTAPVALFTDLLYRASVNLRRAVEVALDTRDLRAENRRLTAELQGLETEVRVLREQVGTLTRVAEIRQAAGPQAVAVAPVTGVDNSPLRSRLTLGLGADQGVRLDMPVTLPGGLVGIVDALAPGFAGVITVVDPASRVGVMVERSRAQAIAAGYPPGLVRIEFDARADVVVGDLLVTGSRLGLYPRGLAVARVVALDPPDPNRLTRTAIARPVVDLNALEEVLLLAPL
jgi:rod shape-determining protein MreC